MKFKNLFFVILLVLLTFVLASCGGSGGGGKKDDKGATMTAEELNTRFTEATEVGDAISTAGNCLEIVMSAGSTYFKSQGMKSMAEDAEGSEEEEGLEWSETPDADGWYTATDTDTWTEEKELGVSITVNWTETYKLRYLAKSATIEFSGTEVYSYSDGSSETFVEFLHIVKGTNGLWNGYKTSDMSSSVEGHHTAKIEFKNLKIDGSGEFIVWIDGKKMAEIIITVVGTQATVSGTIYDENGNPKTLEPKTVEIGSDGDKTDPGEEK